MFKPDLGTSIGFFNPKGVNEDFFDNLKEIKKQGIKCVEVSFGKVGGYGVNMETCTQKAETALNAVLDAGLTLNSVHLPFARFIYISSCDEGVRAWASKEMLELIAVCDKYSPKHYVFHSKTGLESEGLWDARKPALIKSFKEMVASTKANICMENMVASFPGTIPAMKEILEQVEGGKCCIDMNHFLHDKPEDAVYALKDWVTNIHVSDYDFVYEKHWMPKQGKNDWMKIIGALDEIGYKGAFMYEVAREKHGYTFADIRRNYEELFEEYAKYSKN